MAEKILNAQEKHMIYSRDVLHAHSKGVQKIIDLELNYTAECERRYHNGENIIYSSGMQDSPLVYASGAVPLANSELSRLGTPGGIELVEDIFQIPRDVCNMQKVLLAELYLRRGEAVKRLMYSTRVCEPINLVMQLAADFGYDIHPIDFGFRFDDLSEERYQIFIKHVENEYRKASRWISGGKEIEEDKLLEEMKRYNRVVRKCRQIMNLRLSHNTYIRSLPTMFTLMGIGHMFGEPDVYENTLDQILEEMTFLKPGEYHDERLIPIIWTGGRGMEFGVYEAVDNSNGFLAAFCINNCYTREYDTSVPPMEAFVKFQVGGRFSGSTNPQNRELEAAINKTKAKGIISYGFLGCSFGGISAELTREYFKKRNVPMIIVEGSYQVGEPSGQLITRIHAFMEMLA